MRFKGNKKRKGMNGYERYKDDISLRDVIFRVNQCSSKYFFFNLSLNIFSNFSTLGVIT
jgi:hypothetical protein